MITATLVLENMKPNSDVRMNEVKPLPNFTQDDIDAARGFYKNLDSVLKQREELKLPTLWVHHVDMKPSPTLERLLNYIAYMAPHLKEREAGKLLIEAADEIRGLRKEITDMEKAFLITKTHHD